MCKECRRLWEIFAETQLECLKNNKNIDRIIITPCKKCGQNIFIVANIVENNIILFNNKDNYCKGVNNGN